MSFLYQALIKEQQKGPKDSSGQQAEQTSNTAQNPASNQAAATQAQFQSYGSFNMSSTSANESTNNSHWFWLVIAGLLMLVGLLGGYLYASKTSSSQTEQALYSNIQQQTTLIEQKQQQLEQNLAEVKQANEAALAKTVAQPEETAVKQIEVAVDQDGQVQTQVTDKAAEQENTGQPLVRTVLPELAMDEIPDELKSSFESAVKATEQKQNPKLFEANVSSGSSLPLITELKLSEIYWVPNIEYQMHIYASEPSERWIRINDQTLNEGEALIDNLVLLEIRQDQIIWQGNNRRFAQNALEDFVKQ